MIILNLDTILEIHQQIVSATGGSSEIRDMGLLESAVNAPNQSFSDTEFFPTIEEKAARLGSGLIKNHAFVDGNKRIGTVAMLVMLHLNNIEIKYTENDLFDIIMKIADDKAGYEELYSWIIEARDLA